MQNLVAAPTGLNCTACLSQKQRNCSSFGSSCTTQWPQADRSALRCPSTDSANSAAPRSTVVVSAFFGLGGSKSSSAKAGKGCFSCAGKGAIECQGCKGSGKNKKNGNMFERWKCYDCQGFGLVGCPKCGSGGLTPEQRGER
ncbi:hypothetical protein MPTK1_6g16920 [Marchantia polymorpha subsp. ruderalis]|nr:hypothetical protein MARPO_0510s0001 [Marchantia polymorpha]BBN15088.1 hypothetical protein Mp_6g16920 [Marchantia polymorpha subsp. ruderalis]|eukprot:PTQ26727.1 hypothetical protein MARPO_0510s0001 [Marchantia polymorpha]